MKTGWNISGILENDRRFYVVQQVRVSDNSRFCLLLSCTLQITRYFQRYAKCNYSSGKKSGVFQSIERLIGHYFCQSKYRARNLSGGKN